MKKFQVFLEEHGWEGEVVEISPLPGKSIGQKDFKSLYDEVKKQIDWRPPEEQIKELKDLHRKAINSGHYETARICVGELKKRGIRLDEFHPGTGAIL